MTLQEIERRIKADHGRGIKASEVLREVQTAIAAVMKNLEVIESSTNAAVQTDVAALDRDGALFLLGYLLGGTGRARAALENLLVEIDLLNLQEDA